MNVTLLLIVIVMYVIVRAVVSPAKALIPAIRPLLSATLQNLLETASRVFPHAEQGLKRRTDQGTHTHTFRPVHRHTQGLYQMPFFAIQIFCWLAYNTVWIHFDTIQFNITNYEIHLNMMFFKNV